MKLIELKSITASEKTEGTYVALLPTDSTKALVEAWALEHGIPIVDDLHVTVLYSRSKTPVQISTDEHHGIADGFVTLGHVAESKALVVKLQAPTILERHQQLINQGHTHDYPEMIVHMTLLKDPGTLTPESMPPINFGMTFGREFSEEFKT